MLTKQDIETAMKAVVATLTQSSGLQSTADNAAPLFVELAILDAIQSVAEARYKGLTKQMIKDKMLRDISKDRCKTDTTLYSGTNVEMTVTIGTPRTMFSKDKMKTELGLAGVPVSVITKCADAAETTTAAPQSVRFIFK